MTTDPQDVLTFWLGELDEHGLAAPDVRKRWWTKSEAFDDEVRDRFGRLHSEIVAGKREDWLETPRGRLAYVIVLDQLSRNMFRDDAKMYGGDAQARRAVLDGLALEQDRALSPHERVFFYMPLMHSEELIDQERCCNLFRKLASECDGPAAEAVGGNLKYADQHREIVARFGRFPHRNEILGRVSTDEEKMFLEQPGSSF